MWIPKLLIKEMGAAEVNRDIEITQAELNYCAVLDEENENLIWRK